MLSQIYLNYNLTDDIGLAALVKINLYKHGPLADQIEFDVFSPGIKNLYGKNGREITINWQILDFNNDEGIFYTDSNSLKLMKR